MREVACGTFPESTMSLEESASGPGALLERSSDSDGRAEPLGTKVSASQTFGYRIVDDMEAAAPSIDADAKKNTALYYGTVAAVRSGATATLGDARPVNGPVGGVVPAADSSDFGIPAPVTAPAWSTAAPEPQPPSATAAPAKPSVPQPAEFNSGAIVKSPIVMRGVYGARTSGALGSEAAAPEVGAKDGGGVVAWGEEAKGDKTFDAPGQQQPVEGRDVSEPRIFMKGIAYGPDAARKRRKNADASTEREPVEGRDVFYRRLPGPAAGGAVVRDDTATEGAATVVTSSGALTLPAETDGDVAVEILRTDEKPRAGADASGRLGIAADGGKKKMAEQRRAAEELDEIAQLEMEVGRAREEDAELQKTVKTLESKYVDVHGLALAKPKSLIGKSESVASAAPAASTPPSAVPSDRREALRHELERAKSSFEDTKREYSTLERKYSDILAGPSDDRATGSGRASASAEEKTRTPADMLSNFATVVPQSGERLAREQPALMEAFRTGTEGPAGDPFAAPVSEMESLERVRRVGQDRHGLVALEEGRTALEAGKPEEAARKFKEALVFIGDRPSNADARKAAEAGYAAAADAASQEVPDAREIMAEERAATDRSDPSDLPSPPSPPPPPTFNPVVETASQPLSTFAIDVDTAAYTLTRQSLLNGQLPDPALVRTEEIVNAFDYGDRAPEHATFRIFVEGAPAPFAAGRQLVRLGIKGRRLGREEQRPAVLTFLVDASGSMAQPDRIGLVRQALQELTAQLGPGDRLQLLSFNETGRVVLESTPAAQRDAILAAFDRIQPTGPTNLERGMQLAYAQAVGAFLPGAENRVVLLSDGVANLGTAEASDILARVDAARRQGITLTVFGVGRGTYNDRMLEQLANQGDGTYRFLDSPEEVRRAFVDDLAATLFNIASDVKIQVEWNTQTVVRYRQLGYENRALTAEQFRDDTVDAGEVGSGQAVTALYEVEQGVPQQGQLRAAADAPLGTVRVRFRPVGGGPVEEISRPILPADLAATIQATRPAFQVAAGAAAFAERLRQSPHAANVQFRDVADLLRPAALALSLDTRVAELVRLVEAADALTR
jgi:Ca-activated chloride channel family protein